MGSLDDCTSSLAQLSTGPQFPSAESQTPTVSGGLTITNQNGAQVYASGLSTQIQYGPDGKVMPKEVTRTLDQSDNGTVVVVESSCSAGEPLAGSSSSSSSQQSRDSSPVGSVKIVIGGGCKSPPSSTEDVGGGLQFSQDNNCRHGGNHDTARVGGVRKPQPQPVDPDPKFQIFVRNFDGKTNTYWVRKSDTVGSLERQVYERIGIPTDQQRLQISGRNLKEGKLSTNGVHPECTIFLTARLCGGDDRPT